MLEICHSNILNFKAKKAGQDGVPGNRRKSDIHSNIILAGFFRFG